MLLSASIFCFRRSAAMPARPMYVQRVTRVAARVDLVSSKVDYNKGQLPELIDIIINEKAKLFVSAVGVPPRDIVDKLHKAGIFVMNVSPIT